MDASTPIDILLRRIADILAKHNEPEWARSFDRLAHEYDASPDWTKGQIRSIYGGMGSFNDIVLHAPNGAPLGSENDELDRLRSELYAKCRG